MAYRQMPMASGQRDRIITIMSRPLADAASTTSHFPKEKDAWDTLVTDMPASRMDLSGRETFVGSQNAAKGDVRWEINYRADMDPELLDVPKLRRIVHNGRMHDIVSASMIGRKAGVELITIASQRTS